MHFYPLKSLALLTALHYVTPGGRASAPAPGGAANSSWKFVKNGTSGIVALEAIVVSPTLIVTFDVIQNNPLMIDGHSAWAALWNLETNTATPLRAVTDTFCASGTLLSNGTMVNVGGMSSRNSSADGRMSIRLFGPCEDPAGVGCELFDDPNALHLNTTRWYPSSLRIFDGSVMVVGGTHDVTPFFNVDPVNSFEFFPKKDGGAVRPSEFLARSVPVNLFPRAFALPDGRVFMIANNLTQIYDIEKNTETPLPDLPNGVRVSNPLDGTAQLLPLSPPDYIPEVLVCGGSNATETVNSKKLSAEDPASNQCSRITLTEEGIKKGWEVEYMLEGRMMPELILMPNGQVLIINGAGTGYAAINSVSNVVANCSNANYPVLTPSLYTPTAPLGQRISNKGLPTTDIARVYHSSVSLTPSGNVFISGSNPNIYPSNGTAFYNTQYQVEYLNPPYMFVRRPKLSGTPKQILFNQKFRISVNIPKGLNTKDIKVALMDLGFSSHAFHSSARLVFMKNTLSSDRKTLTITAPPNNRVYPPGPGFIFVTIDDVTSEGSYVMVGDMKDPPVKDQGVPLTIT